MLNKKLQSLLEDLQESQKGEVAVNGNEATKEKSPELIKVNFGNKDIFPAEDHEEKEEVKELIIEGKDYSREELEQLFEELELDTHRYTFDYLAEELGFELLEDGITGKGEAAVTDNEATKETDGEVAKPDADNKDTFPADEHEQDEEVEGIVVESYTKEELAQVFNEMELDTDKYTFDYLAEQLGFELVEGDITSKGEVAHTSNVATVEKEGSLLTPAKDNADTFGSDEHEQKEEIEGIVIENKVYSNADLLNLFEELELDTKKYTFEFLAEELGFKKVDGTLLKEARSAIGAWWHKGRVKKLAKNKYKKDNMNRGGVTMTGREQKAVKKDANKFGKVVQKNYVRKQANVKANQKTQKKLGTYQRRDIGADKAATVKQLQTNKAVKAATGGNSSTGKKVTNRQTKPGKLSTK